MVLGDGISYGKYAEIFLAARAGLDDPSNNLSTAYNSSCRVPSVVARHSIRMAMPVLAAAGLRAMSHC